jgi:hypothetical protein
VRRGQSLSDARRLWSMIVMAAEHAAADLTDAPACATCGRLTADDTSAEDPALDCGGDCLACVTEAEGETRSRLRDRAN